MHSDQVTPQLVLAEGHAMKVACVGAGPSGLYFSILMKLQDPGVDITVFEQNHPGVTHGWGVVFFNKMVEGLLRNDPESAHAILDSSFRWVDQVLELNGAPPQRGTGAGFSIQRQDLLNILTQRALHLGVSIEYNVRIQNAAQFADADMIVLADGAGSRLRQLNAHRFRTQVATGRNKYVWLGTAKVFRNFTFGFAPTEAGWIWFHAYGFNEEMSTLIVECSPETWIGSGLNRMSRDACLRRLESLFSEHLSGHSLVCKTNPEDELPWLNFRWVTNDRWYVDKMVLLGDAAHTTHFSIGSGTQLALQDAMCLAAHLKTKPTINEAMSSYQAQRQREIREICKDSRLSARWFENVQDYIDRPSSEFLTLMLGRRSRLLHHIHPGIYCHLDRVTKQNRTLHAARQVATNLYRAVRQ
jgi:2-polyprenyl-6-methoxyphenol hydroxylase-like FAD-dependent oxidoreductase